MKINYVRRALTIALLALSIAAPRSAENSGKGFIYQHDEVPNVPWSIQILKIERTNSNFEMHSMLANGTRIGLNSLQDQIALLPRDLGKPIAAINGDYYAAKAPYKGDPKGVHISHHPQ